MLTIPEIARETTKGSGLRDVVSRWLDRVPLYGRADYSATNTGASISDENWLRRLPFITKSDLRRDFPKNFLGEDRDLDALLADNLLEVEHTSGTSEERTPLLLENGWWARQEALAMRENSFVANLLDEHPHARRVTINSPVCNNDICYTTVPSHGERIVGNALHSVLTRYPFLWSETELARIAAETQAWQPLFLDLDPVYGAVFARYCEREGIRLPSLRFIICSYEFVSVVHRRLLERVFGVPVFILYGATEAGHLLMENERGEMIASPKTAFLEVVEIDARNVGELVATTLTNDYMPLIRYRMGDLVEVAGDASNINYTLHGRRKDSFVTPTGARATTRDIDQCFVDIPGILHYQLAQTDIAEWRLSFVVDGAGPSKKNMASLREQLLSKLGITDGLSFEPTDLLIGEGSGKFRLGYPLE